MSSVSFTVSYESVCVIVDTFSLNKYTTTATNDFFSASSDTYAFPTSSWSAARDILISIIGTDPVLNVFILAPAFTFSSTANSLSHMWALQNSLWFKLQIMTYSVRLVTPINIHQAPPMRPISAADRLTVCSVNVYKKFMFETQLLLFFLYIKTRVIRLSHSGPSQHDTTPESQLSAVILRKYYYFKRYT